MRKPVMHTQITLTQQALQRAMLGLSRGGARTVFGIAGISRLLDHVNLLIHTVRPFPPREETGYQVLIASAESRNALIQTVQRLAHRDSKSQPSAIVALGVGSASGQVCGLFGVDQRYVPLNELIVIDGGMPRILLTDPATPEPTSTDLEMWSRSIGALGLDPWLRLTRLHFGIVGCGRSGSEIAMSLAGIGVQKITLIDGERLEISNLGEMFPVLTLSQAGRAKADVLAQLLSTEAKRRIHEVHSVPESISSQPALIAAKRTDVLICCVDSPSARAATAMLAKLYLKPLIDIGMGIHHPAPRTFEHPMIGADVRLVMPDRCLRCFGGIRRIDEARAEFDRRLRPGLTAPLPVVWHEQRAGSLRSLNMIAVGLAMRLIEELVVGRARTSTWLQVDYAETGLPEIRLVMPPTTAACPMCGLAGLGDSGLHRFREAVA